MFCFTLGEPHIISGSHATHMQEHTPGLTGGVSQEVELFSVEEKYTQTLESMLTVPLERIVSRRPTARTISVAVTSRCLLRLGVFKLF